MIEVRSYKAKIYRTELLSKVKDGEWVLITKHHVPIAMMSPIPLQRKRSVKKTVEAIKKFRKRNNLQGLYIKKMIGDGHR